MTATKTERALRAKARKQGLSLSEFNVIVELSEDLEEFGNIYALAFERTPKQGCCLTLFSSGRSQYKVCLDGARKFRRLTGLVDHSDGRGMRQIFLGDARYIAAWEKLRGAIFWEEGYEITDSGQTSEGTSGKEGQMDFGQTGNEGFGRDETEAHHLTNLCQQS